MAIPRFFPILFYEREAGGRGGGGFSAVEEVSFTIGFHPQAQKLEQHAKWLEPCEGFILMVKPQISSTGAKVQTTSHLHNWLWEPKF